jgi:hypothetical protein
MSIARTGGGGRRGAGGVDSAGPGLSNKAIFWADVDSTFSTNEMVFLRFSLCGWEGGAVRWPVVGFSCEGYRKIFFDEGSQLFMFSLLIWAGPIMVNPRLDLHRFQNSTGFGLGRARKAQDPMQVIDFRGPGKWLVACDCSSRKADREWAIVVRLYLAPAGFGYVLRGLLRRL